MRRTLRWSRSSRLAEAEGCTPAQLASCLGPVARPLDVPIAPHESALAGVNTVAADVQISRAATQIALDRIFPAWAAAVPR